MAGSKVGESKWITAGKLIEFAFSFEPGHEGCRA